MADLTKTISNSLTLFGGGPTSEWGAAVWGTDNWGEGSVDYIESFGKALLESLTMTGVVAITPGKVLANALSLGSDITSILLQDTAGYYTVFVPNTTNGDDQSLATWTPGTDGSTSWSAASEPSTSWS